MKGKIKKRLREHSLKKQSHKIPTAEGNLKVVGARPGTPKEATDAASGGGEHNCYQEHVKDRLILRGQWEDADAQAENRSYCDLASLGFDS